jgi:hypothetical protein
VKIGFRGSHEIPGKVMRFREVIAAFVKIGIPG